MLDADRHHKPQSCGVTIRLRRHLHATANDGHDARLARGTAPFLLAHHSFVAEYDANQPVKVTGVVTRVEWQNPHIWFFVDVKDAQGKVTNWGFSGGPPGVLQRRGISRNALKTGDTVVVEGFRARDGSNNASGGKVTFLTDEASSPLRTRTGLRNKEASCRTCRSVPPRSPPSSCGRP
jgi:hypothetical protein